MLQKKESEHLSPWRESLNQIIFGFETREGKAFDIILIITVLFSIVTVMLDSVESIQSQYAKTLHIAEWIFTLIFTVEYGLRLLCVRKPLLYVVSFFGIIDLLSILPTYISLFIPGIEYMSALRVLRLLRIFRVLKLSEYIQESHILMASLSNSVRKITVFLYVVLTLVVVFGSLMYVIEGHESGFVNIPVSVYWAIVTITTVGYGDITPATPLGQILASIMMIMGYAIIAVPTGIYSAELMKTYKAEKIDNHACPDCGTTGHDFDATYCKHCGHSLERH